MRLEFLYAHEYTAPTLTHLWYNNGRVLYRYDLATHLTEPIYRAHRKTPDASWRRQTSWAAATFGSAARCLPGF